MTIDWNQIQECVRVASRMTGPKEAVLRETRFLNLTESPTGPVARLALQSRLSASMLERLLLPDLKKAFEVQTGRTTRFELEVASRQECFPVEQLSPEDFVGVPVYQPDQVATIRFRERLTLDSTLNFSAFIETGENRFAVEVAKSFASFTDVGFNVLTFHGPAGLGKSHLLHGAGLHAKLESPSLKVKVVTGDDFITDFQNAIVKKNMGDFRRRYRLETDMLLVDDLHSLCRAKATQEEFFNLLNHYASTGRRMVITSDRSIQSLDGLEDRIKSRLSGGLVIAMDYPSIESRYQILSGKLIGNLIDIEPEVVHTIARRAGPCIRSLEGVVNALTMLARTNQLNARMLSQLIQGMQEISQKPSSLDIMQQVATRYGITLDDLRGRSRGKIHVTARRESMTLLKTDLGLSISEIGRLHLRDHSTVLSALRLKRAGTG